MKVCTVDGCERKVQARGYCPAHYLRWRRTGEPGPGELRTYGNKTCTVSGCKGEHVARGLCAAHYMRWQNHGDPTVNNHRETCTVAECTRKHFGHGYCSTHYVRWRKYGHHEGGVSESRMWKPQPVHLPIGPLREQIRADFPDPNWFAKAHGISTKEFNDFMNMANLQYVDFATADTYCNYLGLHPVLIWPEEWISFDVKQTKGRYRRVVAA